VKRHYGYIPDLADQRDLLFPSSAAVHLPPSVDLRVSGMPAVYDQGQLGSCTANALCNAFVFAQLHQLHRAVPMGLLFSPSRLFLYYQERKLEGTVDTDAGAMIRDGAKALRNVGVCDESVYPYVVAHFTAVPSAAAVRTALRHESIAYQRVELNHVAMHACLAQGFPFVVGFTVYESFESEEVAKSGIVPLPGKKERALGGHAVLVCGYDDEAKTYLVQNSWGTDWGQQGYFTVPQLYFENANLASDAWTIRSVER
jgi:C1A family cysteine protease